MKNLGNLSPAIGSNKERKRVGRGNASGNGKTAGKGHKGQKARKGRGPRPGFEGGQTPLYRRLPKYGFTNKRTMKDYHIVKTSQLGCFDDGAQVDGSALVKAGLIKRLVRPVKVLFDSPVEKKLNTKVAKISKNAKVSIESVGGTTEEI